MDTLAAADVLHFDVARKHVHLDVDVGRDLDGELGVDDVVVVVVPVGQAFVGLDRHAAGGLRDVELDPIEPLAWRAADGVHHHVAAVRAGDRHAAGKILELQFAAGADLHGPIDALGFLRALVRVPPLGRRRIREQQQAGKRRGRNTGHCLHGCLTARQAATGGGRNHRCRMAYAGVR